MTNAWMREPAAHHRNPLRTLQVWRDGSMAARITKPCFLHGQARASSATPCLANLSNSRFGIRQAPGRRLRRTARPLPMPSRSAWLGPGPGMHAGPRSPRSKVMRMDTNSALAVCVSLQPENLTARPRVTYTGPRAKEAHGRWLCEGSWAKAHVQTCVPLWRW